MRTLNSTKDKNEIVSRLDALYSDQLPRWGKMNAHQMIVHLTDILKAALNERPVPYAFNVFGIYPINKFLSQHMWWPPGSPTAREFIQGKKGSALTDFESDKQSLRQTIDRFVQAINSKPFPLHPTFGELTNQEWARLMWRHIDHHLRQFRM